MSFYSRLFPTSLLSLLIFTLLVCGNGAQAIRVRATSQELSIEVNHEEVCMYSTGENSNEGAMLHYHVLHGGDDFDVYIRDPRNRTVYVSYAGEHEMEDRVYFTKHMHGEYAYCIDNRPYSGSRKVIKLVIGVTSLTRWKERIDPLTRLMLRTDSYMLGLHEDQIIFRLREQDLRKKVDESSKLLLARGLTETVIIVFVSVLHVLLIKHLFTKKGVRAVA
ncbi:cop-coated vesicle membrane protein p24 precursor [Trypanosoma theileri]|uniref:Cop-coated vesicle membrane protein p24 n=1 Tax=Trypanosoma theileri TaxID=67003 RepID=A0A1X0NPX7_9TRYP|nr:cop-coated vesicle membrane protein p24 precursor [Trypanosoma theileri]ORC86239.1 cop-coated vesicle membrane protein p24 precursor [Trypanosoma theileri]